MDVDTLPFGVELLNRLYLNSLQTSTTTRPLFLMLLDKTSKPYLEFIQKWIFEAQFNQFKHFVGFGGNEITLSAFEVCFKNFQNFLK